MVLRNNHCWSKSGQTGAEKVSRRRKNGMIDNYVEAVELLQMMEKALPIFARATKACVRGLRNNGIKIKQRQDLQIESVLYLGDDGGIGCGVRWSPKQEAAVVVSLTHIRIKKSEPLAKEILAYQNARTEKLARISKGHVPTGFSLTPYKKGKGLFCR